MHGLTPSTSLICFKSQGTYVCEILEGISQAQQTIGDLGNQFESSGCRLKAGGDRSREQGVSIRLQRLPVASAMRNAMLALRAKHADNEVAIPPTAPTYQLYDLPHKKLSRPQTHRACTCTYIHTAMDARGPWRVVREMKGWEQASGARGM